jgi:subtilisin family serine protease
MTPASPTVRVLCLLVAAGLMMGQGVAATADPNIVTRASATSGAAPPAGPTVDDGIASDRVTVVFREGVDARRAARDVVARAQQLGGAETKLVEVGASLGAAVLDGAPDDILEHLAADPSVEAVAPDRHMSAMLGTTTSVTGSDRTLADGLDGRGQTVAVIDSGVDASHPALKGSVVAEACFTSDSSCPNGQPTQSGPGAATPCATPGAACAHGTHVAGIVAARARPGEAAGVAPGAKLAAIQVFREGGDGTSAVEVTKALTWVAEHGAAHGVVAVNLSLGYNTSSGAGFMSPCDGHSQADPAIRLLIERLRDAGTTTVVAAGNNAFDGRMSFPACLADAVAVGATTNADQLTSFSNISGGTDLLAPGDQVRSPVPNGGYAEFSGTSMAAPHVAGAVALLHQRSSSASPATVRRAMRQTGTPIATPAGPVARLDVHRARLAPSRPPSAGARHGDGSATVTWGVAGRNAGSSITGYRITVKPGDRRVTVPASARSATINGLTNGTRHTFEVRAVNQLVAGPLLGTHVVIPKPPAPSHGFADVRTGVYFDQPVRWLKAEAITDGYGKTGTYAPDRPVSRAQMAAFLWRSMDAPIGHPHHGFRDVPKTSYYSDAVRWLKAEGITHGYGRTNTYAPDVDVTRAQMAAFLWRVAGEPTGYPHHGFHDVPSDSYYSDAVRWLKAEGITDGYGRTNTYAPDVDVTRAQMAAFLHRLATRPSAWDPAKYVPSTIAF